MSGEAHAFPPGFVWGAATAAHQVEGGNVGSDCWALEHARPSLFREPSGDAVDQYHRFADDMAIVAGLGLAAYRFSIEWARIEPEEGSSRPPWCWETSPAPTRCHHPPPP